MPRLPKSFRPLALGLFLLTLLAGCAGPELPRHPDQLSFQPLQFNLPDVDRLVLPNGIHLYLKEDNEVPLVRISAMVGSGSLAMPRDKVGIAGLFAETWRTGGTEQFPPDDLEGRLDLLAADLGASVGTYSVDMSLSVRAPDLPEGLTFLAEFLRRPTFADEKLELARLKALEQLRRQNDSPGEIASRLLMAALYPDHPLGDHPTEASLKRVTQDDLFAFHREYFAPNNLWLAISGDFDRAELLALLNRVFGDWAVRDLPPQIIPPLNHSALATIQFVEKDIPQTTILIGDIGLTKDHPDQYAVRVMNYILGGGGFNSRMMREIRSDRGLAYSAYSYFQVGRRLPGPFVAGTETKTETVLPTVRLIREIMQAMRRQQVSDDELRLAKESLINSFVFGFDNTHAVVAQQMRLDFYDYPEDYLANYRARIAAVTIEDVQRAAEQYIRFGSQQIVLVGQEGILGDGLEDLGLPVKKVDPDKPSVL